MTEMQECIQKKYEARAEVRRLRAEGTLCAKDVSIAKALQVDLNTRMEIPQVEFPQYEYPE